MSKRSVHKVLVSLYLGLELMLMPPEIILSSKSVIQLLLALEYFQLDGTIHKKKKKVE